MIRHRETKTLNEFRNSDRHYDLFICSASFEDRCLAVASSIDLCMIGTALVCRYSGYAELSEGNNAKLLEILAEKAKGISFDKDAPLSIYDTLYDAILECHPKSVIIDISTFTRETILIILMLFKQEAFKDIEVTLCYVLYLGCVPPRESHSEELSKINKANFDRLVSLVGECNIFEFSCRYLQQTHDSLKEIIEANKEDYNIIISPMNNKLST